MKKIGIGGFCLFFGFMIALAASEVGKPTTSDPVGWPAVVALAMIMIVPFALGYYTGIGDN